MKRLTKTVAIFSIFLIVYLPLQAKKDDQKTILKGFPEFVEKTMKEWKVPGVVISIVKDGKVIFAQGFGLRDVKQGLKVTPQTIFAIGSSSKAFTATAIGILVDEGKIDWDKPVRTYLPAFKLYDPVASERMTPRDLLCHRSGLPRHDLMWIGSSASRKNLFDRLANLEPSRDFRSTFQYQNLMFMTAGHLVGEVTGTTWEDFVKLHIFEPLGMKDSNFSVNDSQKASDFALPYREKEDKVLEIAFRNIEAIGPAGSINSNVVDMANWVLLNLNKGKWGEKQIISEASLNQLHSPQMIAQEAVFRRFEQYEEFLPQSYGLGWFIAPYRGHLLIHHGGNIDGFSALVSFLPRDKAGMVVLTNLNGTLLPYIIAFNLCDRLLGLDQVPWNMRMREMMNKMKEEAEKAKKEKDKDRKPDTKPSHPLEDYAGDFEHPSYGVMSIKKEGELLKATYNSMPYDVSHYHYDIFEFKNEFYDITQRVFFFTDSKGNIGSLSIQLEPALKEIVFTRMPEKKMMEKSFLEKFMGEYILGEMTVKISLKGEKTLILSIPGQPDYELVPYKGTEFNIKNIPGASIEFILDESGQVKEAKFSQPGGTLTAKKK